MPRTSDRCWKVLVLAIATSIFVVAVGTVIALLIECGLR